MLEFEPFHRVAEIDRFTCGSSDLDDFIKTEEVERYDEQGYGATTLVWKDHALVAYYTAGRGEVDTDRIESGKKTWKTKRYFVEENIPAWKIGRLAVDRSSQNKGLGRILVAKIANEAIESPSSPLIMVVRANPASIDFYRKWGFQPMVDRPRKATSSSLTLFFRLDVLHPGDVRADVDI